MSDDGYANTLTVAADILEEMTLPWSLFVSTHHIDTRERNPVFIARLFAFYAPAGAYRLPGIKDVVVLSDSRSFRELAAERLISLLKMLNGPAAKAVIDTMVQAFLPARFDELLARFPSEDFLTWDSVRALAKRGVTIGAHANWHWPMNAAQSAEYLHEQTALPKQRIEAEVGACRHFAYPFGNVEDVSRGAWQAVRDAGYANAFTTLAGSLDARMNPYLLPRYGLAQRESNAASLIALLRTGNGRVLEWQKTVAA
jgi:peptidoglycan/xylan/chitin deacetylase (PgdA/CDA1 family)